MPANWDKTVATATKVLGDKGKVPPMPDALTSGIDKGRKSVDEVTAILADLQAKLIAMQQACGDVVRNGQKFQSAVGKETFGLDPKNPEDAKKIQQARALLDAYLSKANKGTGEALIPMTKFENALSSFSKEIGSV